MIDTLLYATTGMAVVGALAAWAWARNQAARLRDLQERIDSLDDILAEMGQTATAFDCGHPSTTPLVLKRPVTPDSMRVVGKSPDLAAPFTGEARHPLYAKTGLPNQPVASLRPDTPPCSKCGKPRAWTAGKLYGKDATLAHCKDCRETETPDGGLVYTGYSLQPSSSLKPNWTCPNCSYRSYQLRAGEPRCPICKRLET